MNNPFEHRGKIFNTPIEYALRSLLIITKIGSNGIDIDRLIAYDYLVLNSGDIQGGPESIHPPIPFRSAQILIKRDIIKKGINILLSKELIGIKYSKQGIYYIPTDLTLGFITYLNSKYFISIQERISWVINQFANYSDNKLKKMIDSNLPFISSVASFLLDTSIFCVIRSISLVLILSRIKASENIFGSLSYTPETSVAYINRSASNSRAI